MRFITYDEVAEAVHAVIEERPAHRHDECIHFAMFGESGYQHGEPVCLVGHALAHLGLTHRDLRCATGSMEVIQSAADLHHVEGADFAPEAVKYLVRCQAEADHFTDGDLRTEWKRAVEQAEMGQSWL